MQAVAPPNFDSGVGPMPLKRPDNFWQDLVLRALTDMGGEADLRDLHQLDRAQSRPHRVRAERQWAPRPPPLLQHRPGHRPSHGHQREAGERGSRPLPRQAQAGGLRIRAGRHPQPVPQL